MAPFKNQHFVPKCLLKPFTYQCEGRAIHLYNIRHDRFIERASVKGQCAKHYLYGKDATLEHLLSNVEGSFNYLRPRITDYHDDTVEFQGICVFTYLQLNRTDIAMQRVKEWYGMASTSISDRPDNEIIQSVLHDGIPSSLS
jgi:5'(3')-deoxyribonucleotidase